MDKLTLKAATENLDCVLEFINKELDKHNCNNNTKLEIDIAIEEIYVNIANYAYNPEIGAATILCEILDNPLRIIIKFMDNGKPYNPLEKPDPDITLGALERSIGGLGIYMVKNSMTDISYEYTDNTNILTIVKNL